MRAVPGEKENKTGLLSYGNGDEKKGTHSLAEGRPEHYYNSLSFVIIPYNSLSFLIIPYNSLSFLIILYNNFRSFSIISLQLPL